MEPRMQRKQISPATVGDADRALNVWPMQLCQARDDPLCRQPRPVPRRLQRWLGAALVGIVIAMALVNSSVQAADFTANDTTTLTDAINSANDETTNPGADTITLTDDVTLSAALPTITSKVTIEGDGHFIDGDDQFQVLQVRNPSGDLTVNDTTIQNGYSNFNGGGIEVSNQATLAVNNSTFSGNSAKNNGGGLFNGFTATVTNTTFSGNSADLIDGGGIANLYTLTVINSTLSNNTGSRGGGIFNLGFLILEGTLIAGNTARTSGNEIHNFFTVTANNFNVLGSNAANRAANFSNFTPGANDFDASSDQQNIALANILDPTLADNGGPTATHALVPSSPAINFAGDSGLDTDQRGIARPQGSADDSGAFELQTHNNAVSQSSVAASYNEVPQSCAATGTSLPIHTVTPTLQNSSTDTFTDLIFRVKRLEYRTDQGGMSPSLCNATTVIDNGGVGSLLAIPNGSLPGSDNEYNPGDSLAQALEVGLPVRAGYRSNVDLLATQVNAASVGTTSPLQSLGTFVFEFDPTTAEATKTEQLFLPLVIRE